MKSLLTKIISALITCILAVSLCACNTTSKTNKNCEGGHVLVDYSYTTPTCKTNGEKTRKCSRCGFIETETLLSIDHDYQVKSTTPSSCTIKGSQTLECSMCHETFTNTLPLLNHDYKEVNTATCFTDGELKNVCSECQHEEVVETISMFTHEFDAGGYCTKCGIYETLLNAEDTDITTIRDDNSLLDQIIVVLKPKFNKTNPLPEEYFTQNNPHIILSFYNSSSALLANKEMWLFGTTTLHTWGFEWCPELNSVHSFKLTVECDGFKPIEITHVIL